MQMDMTQSWLSYHITSGHGIPCSMVFFTIAIFCKIILYSLVVFTNRLDALTVHISFFGVLRFLVFLFLLFVFQRVDYSKSMLLVDCNNQFEVVN